MKNPLNKHHLIVDVETAPIIRRIFQMRCQGLGHRAIVNVLNEERVPSPREVFYSRRNQENPTNSNGLWSTTSVRMLLSSEVYLGHLVQGKHTTVSYKNRKMVNKPEDQWIRVEGTHEALVSQEDWETVRSLDKRNYKPRKDSQGEVHLFSSLLKCAECGYNLRAHITYEKRKDGTKVRRDKYICGNYARSGKAACSAHIIQESVLAELILDEIRAYATEAIFDEARVIQSISNEKNRESVSLNALHRQQLQQFEKRLAELDKIIRTLYEDRVKGIVSESMFTEMVSGYEQERTERNIAVAELRLKVKQCEQISCDVSAWVKAIRKYSELETLTREVLIELIDNIEVFEPQKINKQRVCRIKIHYRFVGVVGEAQEGGAVLDHAV
jgi:hypothetical protein